MVVKLALVGLGKIARDQHLPAIAATPGLELAAIASRNAALPDLPAYPDVAALLAAEPDVGAVSLCTPPQGRFAQARAALAAGRHLMLEKPPGASLAEVQELGRMAQAAGLSIFATWHSREAAAVEPARAFLRNRKIRKVEVVWREDVRHWHPGQQWIWEPGGLGVFDPGINALSIVTRILPEAMRLTAADLEFPANRDAPIAAKLAFETAGGAPVSADFDWRQTGPQTWDVRVETDQGAIALSKGGSVLIREGEPPQTAPDEEYKRLYRRFAALIAEGASDLDLSPLTHVADAFLLGRRLVVDAFED